MSDDNGRDDDGGVPVLDDVKDTEKQKLEPPPKYNVVLINDDFTPMDFVVAVLQQIFGKGMEDATKIMLEVHQKGKGIAETTSREIAETRVSNVNALAQAHEHPLRTDMEKA